MNQPKFKIDDTVYYPGRKDREGMRFTVTKIEIIGCGEYVYLDHRESPVHISHLELYQEPQNKKLYAWASHDGVIFHVKNKDAGREVFHRIGIDAQSFTRSPEDDIEYPEATK